MKKSILLAVLCLIMTAALAACGNKQSEDPNKNGNNNSKNQVTITFMDGDTELGKITANAGEVLKGYEKFQAKEGYTFLGWFKAKSLFAGSKFDLATATFNEDTTLFASFKSDNVTADTRNWYIVGEGKSPVLKLSAWAGASVSDGDKEKCQLKLTGNAANEFQITVDLFAGDKFQIIHDWQWDGQKGYGLLKGLDKELFESGGGLSGDANTSNVGVLKDGSYTITLTTDPDSVALDAVKVVRNGDPVAAPADDDPPFVPGENTRVIVKGSWVADWSENIDLTRNAGTNVFTISKEFAAGIEIYIMVWDGDKDTGIGFNSSTVKDDASKALIEDGVNNIKFKEAGTYTITVDVDALTVTITK